MTEAEAKTTITENRHLLKDDNDEGIVYEIEGVERYFTGYAHLNEELILYFAPTTEAMTRGNTEPISLEWTEFMKMIGE